MNRIPKGVAAGGQFSRRVHTLPSPFGGYVPERSALDECPLPSPPAHGQLCEVRGDDGARVGAFIGAYLHYEPQEIDPITLWCVVPLDQDGGNLKGLPVKHLVLPEQVTPLRSSTTKDDLSEWVAVHPSPPVTYAAPKRSARALVAKPGTLGIGASVEIQGRPGRWVVISLAPSGALHVQHLETGELLTAPRKELSLAGHFFEQKPEEVSLF